MARSKRTNAGMVQLVECFLAKEEVTGSSPVARSGSRSNERQNFLMRFVSAADVFSVYNQVSIRILQKKDLILSADCLGRISV